jgi:hypothetical protein
LKHTPVVQDAPANAGEFFLIIHILFSNIKAWLVGTHHGVSASTCRATYGNGPTASTAVPSPIAWTAT